MTLETTNYILALGTIAIQMVTVMLLIVYWGRNRSSALRDISDVVVKWGVVAAFALSFIGSALTLYYSEVLGIAPCALCWWQRIFLYPQVLLFAVALWKRDAGVACYSIALSVAGAAFALYHHALQMLPGAGLPCPASGPSCAQRMLFEFGYITYPLMAVSLFALIIVIMLMVRRK